MHEKDSSSFMRGVESRLDSLFNDDVENVVHSKENIPDTPSSHENSEPIKLEKKKLDDIPYMNNVEELSSTAGKADKPSIGNTGNENLNLKDIKKQQENNDIMTSKSILLSPLKELKSIILALEWEMSDDTLDQLDDEIKKLNEIYQDDHIICPFLKILCFLGRYIRVKKTNADINSTSLLFSIYKDLEIVIMTESMNLSQKQSILLEDINKYKGWVDQIDLELCAVENVEEPIKELIPETPKESDDNYYIPEPTLVLKEAGSIEKQPPESVKFMLPEASNELGNQEQRVQAANVFSPDSSAIQNMSPHEAFAYALEEIKRTISVEMAAIRVEIKMWRNGQ